MPAPVLIALFCSLLLAGCSQSGQQGKMRGGPEHSLPSLLSGTNIIQGNITVHGEMVEKCAVAGCWFYLESDGSRIKVDTKNAGFSASDTPLHAQVKVSGALARQGDSLVLEATGMEW